jgi:hypothetical protein
MTHYKFLDSAHVSNVLIEGTIVISSFEYFRRLEEAEWSGIADPLEAATELTSPDRFLVTEGSSELAQVNSAGIGLGLVKQFAKVESGGVLDISGMRFIHKVQEAFVYSASWGNFIPLRNYMFVEAERKYDACLKLRSLHRLERRLFDTGYIPALDCRFSDIFERGERKTVEYEPRSNSLPERVLIPSAFKKGVRFRGQSEARITFVPKTTLGQERLIVRISDPGTIFERI